MKSFRLIALIWLIAITANAEEQQSSFRLNAQLQDGWVIDYRPEFPPYTIQVINGSTHLLFQSAGSLEDGDPAGTPMLPIEPITFGIPAGMHLKVELAEAVYDTQRFQIIAPHPTYTVDDSQQVHAAYTLNASAYNQNRLFPSVQFLVDDPQMLRDQLTSTIRMSPLRYNPVTRGLIRLVKAKIRITLANANSMATPLPQGVAPTADPLFEGTYKSVLWNYDQARVWRTRSDVRSSALPTDSTRDWFQTGQNYYRALVAADGWYKITKQQLTAAGANGSSIDLPSLKVFFRGSEIPCIVWPDTSVEFYGVMNHGDTSYYDFYTDTSTYWVTWGGVAGKRYATVPRDTLPPSTIVSTGRTTKHIEQNNYYYPGAATSELVDFETVPGEGWAWGEAPDWFFPNTMKTFAFALDDLDTLGIPQATIRARLVGTTVSPYYHARFWINQPVARREVDLVGEIVFPGRTSAVMTTTFPHEMLRRGENALRVHSFISSGTNQFYLDWFEVDYNRELVALNNRVIFSTPNQPTQTRTTFRITGLTSSDAEAYDVTNFRKIQGSIQGSGPYTFFFTDTVKVPRKYAVVSRNAVSPVPPLEQKQFKDIRANLQGADYIIITHKNFLSSAQQLATYRQVRNSVRAKVIDVQDIYDEFNFGTLNATKIKTFLKHAYDTWPAPRPAVVLMFGDASWDYHRYLATSRFTNYVPSYGVPACDHWFVSFRSDTALYPSMFIGRVPVRSSIEAEQAVEKLTGYESYTLGDWNKKYLFISGNSFGPSSEIIIQTRITPPPLGATVYHVIKTSGGAIDGENTAYMKQLVKEGVVVINFIGHSGGRIWEVDMGPIGNLENTNGRLPFVSSVSCNVGAFADPASYVLTEDWLLTPGKGGIGSWATSGLGFPETSVDLLRFFYQGVRDTVRMLGALTTNAKIQYLRANGTSSYVTRSTLALNTLVGDPLTSLAVATKPDLAVSSEDVTVNIDQPTPADTVVQIKAKLHNYGLVPADSVRVKVTDVYSGQSSVISERKLVPTRQLDSVQVQWRGTTQVGPHALTVTLDPLNTIPEVSELNNIFANSQYVFANYLSVVKPIDNTLVPPGVQRLVVSRPIGVDTTGFSYEFQLDTTITFDSPFLVQSGLIAPGPVSGEWSTPSLPVGRLYFWRARTVYPSLLGRWVVACFVTSTDIPTSPLVRWRENLPAQFRREKLSQVTATDTGTTISRMPITRVLARSLGFNYNQLAEYYSIVRVNEMMIKGYFFDASIGTGFLVARINDATGAAEFRAFNNGKFPADSGRAHSNRFAGFINQTPPGNYIAFATIFDGTSNITDSLRNALQQLGSTRVGQFNWGQGWAFVGRKGVNGPGMIPIEVMTNDSATINYDILNFYGLLKGSLTTTGLTIPSSWDSFHWRWHGPAATNVRVAFLGVRQSGAIDTLRILPKDSTDVSLAFLNPITSGGTYRSVRTAALLSTSDALVTPTFTDWWLDFTPAPDLAVSARLLAADASANSRNVEITVYNLGFRSSDSASINVSVIDGMNRSRIVGTFAIPQVDVGKTHISVVNVRTSDLPARSVLQVEIVPHDGSKDLVDANNVAYYSLPVQSQSTGALRVYVDGVEILEGDYISPTPTITVRPEEHDNNALTSVTLAVDNALESQTESRLTLARGNSSQSTTVASFTPSLSNGMHELKFIVHTISEAGETDTSVYTLHVNVSSESRLLNVMNYPNPFSRETFFTFVMSGSTVPEEIAIRVFTIAGRKVRDIRIAGRDLRLGFNRVQWDGRDEDGDEIANGYYLYQITMQGNQKSESTIQKLTKIR